ncbi:hypothetical protein PTKIN_Ptkin18bG0034800 [Pterospermum kingtungense]
MYSIKSRPVLLLTTFFFIFSFSHEASSSSYHAPPKPFPGMKDIITHGIRRSVLEGVNDLTVQNSTLVLASERTHWRDHLDSFNYYKGGWNISEKHYFSSVGFTAAPLFLIAAIWFLGFGMCLLVITLCNCCCLHQHYGYSQTIYLLSLIFLAFFTTAAVIGCIILCVGQGKFHNSSTDTLEYVVQQADMTVDKLRNGSDYLEAAKQIQMNGIVLPPNIQADIERVDKKINDSAKTLETKTEENSDKIQHFLDCVRLCLIIIAAVMLLLAFLGFGREMDDSCVAMDEWVQYPTAHTALDDIIPSRSLQRKQRCYNTIGRYALHYYAPFLVDVGDCTCVREIFSNITKDHCPGLSESSEMISISIGLVVVSTAVMLLVTLWFGCSMHQEHTEYDLAASPGDHPGRVKSM